MKLSELSSHAERLTQASGTQLNGLGSFFEISFGEGFGATAVAKDPDEALLYVDLALERLAETAVDAEIFQETYQDWLARSEARLERAARLSAENATALASWREG